MSFSNLDRVKKLLELTIPALKTRNDYDDRINRLMGVVHEKIRLKIVKVNGGNLPSFLILEDFTPPIDPLTLTSPLVQVPARIRFRLRNADEGQLTAAPMIATVTGDVDGIETTSSVTFTRNGEFITDAAFEVINANVAFSPIPAIPGEVQVLQDIDPTLADIEDYMTACLFLREAVDRFEKDAQPEEMERFCKMASGLLKTWIEVNVAADVLDSPLALRAES